MHAAPELPPSHWWTDPVRAFPALGDSVEGDVVIIGGGIAGVTLAVTLAARGVRAVLLEAGFVAGAASGRNAGFLMAGPAEPYTELVALYGRPGARAVLLAGRRNHERLRGLIGEWGIACDYRMLGSVRLTRTEEEAEDQRASLPLLREDGARTLEIAVSDAVPAEAARSFRAAFFDPDDGEVDPVRLVRGLAEAAAKQGAQVFEHSPVSGAQWSQEGWRVATPGGTAHSRILVLATNAYASRLCPALAPLVQPRRGQMLSTAPVAREIAKLPTYAHWGYHYWRQLADGRILIGGWRDVDLDGETGFEDAPNAKIQSAIEAGLGLLVPEGVAIEHRWAGTMGFARDGRPLVGWLDAGHQLAICAGFTGHGMGMAAACSEGLAELLSFREAPAVASFAPSRFPELARHTGPFIPQPSS